MDTVIDTATVIAAQTDRWMFVFLLIIVLSSIWVLFRYFTAKLDTLQIKLDTQTNEFLSHLKTANKEMIDVLALATSTIDRNSRLLERLDRQLHAEGLLRTRSGD